MSLINCPSCQKQISDKSEICPHCENPLKQSEEDLNRIKVLTFTAMAIAIIGLVPMLWTYAKAIDYGFNANLLNHWGIYLIMAGFALYVVVRIMMFNTKRNYKASK